MARHSLLWHLIEEFEVLRDLNYMFDRCETVLTSVKLLIISGSLFHVDEITKIGFNEDDYLIFSTR